MTYLLALGAEEEGRYRWMAEQARSTEAGTWEAAGVVPGAAVADLGCGPGAILVELAIRVTPAGRVDGIDNDPGAVATAQAAILHLPHARVAVGDVAATGLEAGRYDVVMLRHVLGHLGAAGGAAIHHAVALLRPGGRLIAVDTDLAAVRRIPPDPDLDDESACYTRLLVQQGGDPLAGPRLGRSLEACGLELVEFGGRADVSWLERLGSFGPPRAARGAILTAGLATPADAERWDRAGERYLRDPRGKYVVVPSYLAVGRKPT